jgi:hypothetical protein
MDLELATTHDILLELHHRGAHFVYAGFQPTYSGTGEVYFACQGQSSREAHRLIRLLEKRLFEKQGPT